MCSSFDIYFDFLFVSFDIYISYVINVPNSIKILREYTQRYCLFIWIIFLGNREAKAFFCFITSMAFILIASDHDKIIIFVFCFCYQNVKGVCTVTIDVQFIFRYEDWIAIIFFRIRALYKKNLIMNLANNTCSLTLRNIEWKFSFQAQI